MMSRDGSSREDNDVVEDDAQGGIKILRPRSTTIAIAYKYIYIYIYIYIECSRSRKHGRPRFLGQDVIQSKSLER
jgi:hypothetical protein